MVDVAALGVFLHVHVGGLPAGVAADELLPAGYVRSVHHAVDYLPL